MLLDAGTWETCAQLLLADTDWIRRRKDTVTILDDTALQKRTSVDFQTDCLPCAEVTRDGDRLLLAPVFVLPKAEAVLMSFDLVDESNKRLSLTTKSDNATFSGEVLVAMAAEVLGRTIPNGFADSLRDIAGASPREADEIRRLLLRNGASDLDAEDMGKLRSSARFRWWSATLGHSSIAPAIFRHPRTSKRKLLKLDYKHPIAAEPGRSELFGLHAYHVGVDSSWIEAQSYHVEVQAPEGCRITEAKLSDDLNADPATETGHLRRVHLYLDDASSAGAGTTSLELRTNTQAFLGGAVTASGLTTLALLVCAWQAPNIAANPTSAPSLFLLFPGLIASYVNRPDQHPLTSRMLSGVRVLLLASALMAFAAAAFVGLGGATPRDAVSIESRATTLRLWLGLLASGSLLSSLPTGLAFALTQPRWRLALELVRSPRPDTTQPRFRVRGTLRQGLAETRDSLLGRASGQEGVFGQKVLQLSVESSPGEPGFDADSLLATRVRFYGTWIYQLKTERVWGGTHIRLTADLRPRFGVRLLSPFIVRRHRTGVIDRLELIEARSEYAGLPDEERPLAPIGPQRQESPL